jgi:CheY-like chemotaxis protein
MSRSPLPPLNVDPEHDRPKAAPEGATALEGVRVLVVDDDEDTRDLIAAVLVHEGAQLAVAASVAEARAVLSSFVPGVVVTDIGLPEEDGFALLREARARLGPNVPVVAVTGYASTDDAERARAAGFAAHLTKPMSAHDLVATLIGVTRG